MPCTLPAGPAVPRHGQGMGKVPVPHPPPRSGFGGRRKAEEAGTLGPFHLSMGQHNQTLALCIDIPSGISGRINLCPGRSPPDTAGSWGWGSVLQSNAWLPLLLRDAADYLSNSFQLSLGMPLIIYQTLFSFLTPTVFFWVPFLHYQAKELSDRTGRPGSLLALGPAFSFISTCTLLLRCHSCQSIFLFNLL